MKLLCGNEKCSHKGQEIEVRAETLLHDTMSIAEYEELYNQGKAPFFFTIPPVYCGYCGFEAKRV